jgi:hypothetical protein
VSVLYISIAGAKRWLRSCRFSSSVLSSVFPRSSRAGHTFRGGTSPPIFGFSAPPVRSFFGTASLHSLLPSISSCLWRGLQMVKNAGIVNEPLKRDPTDADARKQCKRELARERRRRHRFFLDLLLRFPFILMCPRIWLLMCLKMTTDPSFSLYRTSISSSSNLLSVQLLSHGQMMCVNGIAFGNVALNPISCGSV